MKPLMLADCHCHSANSFDGSDSISEMYAAAAERGAIALTVTDHFETACYDKPEQCDTARIAASVADVLSQREKGGDMPILRGVELGQPLSDLSHAQTVLDVAQYDFILGSVHVLKGDLDFYYIDYKVTDAAEIYGRYLDDLLATVEWGGFDSLAHLTYPRRYMLRDGALPDIAMFKKKTLEILALAVEKGIAIEINTNAKNQPNILLDEYFEVMRSYKKLGGKLVTLGSDAHCADNVANGFEIARDILTSAGFDRAYYYVNRQPVEYKI